MKFPHQFSIEDFSRCFSPLFPELPKGFEEKFREINTGYRPASVVEREEYILEVLRTLSSRTIRRTREKNLEVWERGWGENYEMFLRDPSEISLRPRYFRPARFFRLLRDIVIPENPNIEFELFNAVRSFLFSRFFGQAETVYELGAGSCQNILALSNIFPHLEIIGLDWTAASARIAELLGSTLKRKISGARFDLADPPERLSFKEDSFVFSIHALEQLGGNHEHLIDFLLRQKPRLVLHYEPILELFDDNNVYDVLARMYCRKRNYLRGYLTALKKLQKANKLEILHEFRPCIGGVHIEASLVVWRPVR